MQVIYIGRHFRNDIERLEKLFEMYKKMTTTVSAQPLPEASMCVIHAHDPPTVGPHDETRH